MQTTPRIDPITVAGLALLLMPSLTMLHEIGGHAAMCLATGHRVTELGAFYVNCDADTGPGLARKAVALAGPAIDAAIAYAVYPLWKRAANDLFRLALWYVWLGCGFSSAGYFAYSGVTGIGDLGPGIGGGIGPLPAPYVWRALLALGGGYAYWLLIRAGMAGLGQMIGQGADSIKARRTAAHLFYAVLCLAAVLASLLNPIGLFITLASATAASFGGKAGLISIGFATQNSGSPRGFDIPRSWTLFLAGLVVSGAFALVLGPTLRLA